MHRTLLALACFGAVAWAAPKRCDPHRLDACAAKTLFFAENTTATTDPKAVVWSCEQEKLSIECMYDYNKHCVTGLAQGVSKLVIEGAAQESNLKCEPNGPKNKAYYKYLPCINKNGVKIHKCMIDTTKKVEAATSAPVKDRVPHMCCALHGFQNCALKATKETCDDNHVAYVHSVIEGAAGDILDTVCAKFKPESASCKSLPSLKLGKTQKFRTLVPPVLDVLKSL